jgi:SAM-dependent methyltransferase
VTDSKNKQFAHYARYYDLLYDGKDYTAESRFVHDRLCALGAQAGDLLELGSGTGKHAMVFAELGWKVTGIDLSANMVAQARQRAAKTPRGVFRKPTFRVGNMVNLRLGRGYDAVVSLFHVIGYQTSNLALSASIKTAADHLKPDGLFFFDFWFGPAVLTEKPSVRIKRFSDKAIDVTRISEPVLDVNQNIVSINFDVFVEDKRTHVVNRISENHRMRYFFVPELERFLTLQGLEIVAQGKWMNVDPMDSQSWYGWIAAKKVTKNPSS